jgi:hypothetical protein
MIGRQEPITEPAVQCQGLVFGLGGGQVSVGVMDGAEFGQGAALAEPVPGAVGILREPPSEPT